MKIHVSVFVKFFYFLKSIFIENINLFKDVMNDYNNNYSTNDFIMPYTDDLIKDSELFFFIYELKKDNDTKNKILTEK